MKVLITGAAGFVGSNVMKELKDRGIEVAGTDKEMREDIIPLNILDFTDVLGLLNGTRPDAVIHLAAVSGATGKNEVEQSMRQPHLNFNVNATGTLNLCEACRLSGVRRFGYLSSFAVYGKITKDQLPIKESTPTRAEHAYGVSKLHGEDIVRTYSTDFGIKSVILRAPFIAGEYQKEKNVLREFLECATNDRSLVIYGEGNHIREFIHPMDVADAFAKALEYLKTCDAPCELFILGNEPVRIADLADLVIARMGQGRVKHVPLEMDRTFDQYTDHQKAKGLLNWSPMMGISAIIDRIVSLEELDSN